MNKRKIEQAIKKHAENEALDFFLSIYPADMPFNEILSHIGKDDGSVYSTNDYCNYCNIDLIEMLRSFKKRQILSIKNLLKKLEFYNAD